MPLDAARWQIDILAADKTAAAFTSATSRLRAFEQANKQMAATTNTVLAATTARFAALKQAINEGTAAASGSGGLGSLLPILGRLGPIAAAAAAAYLSFRAGMKAADLGEQAEQLGLTADQLQAYRLVAAQA